MSERHSPKHETHHSPESLTEHKESLDSLRHEKNKQAKQAEQDHAKHLESARKAAEQHAESAPDFGVEDTNSQLNTISGHQLLKKDAYKQLLKRTQKKLSKPSRLFSRLIHNSSTERISEISGKTVARPSGLLGGGVGAFTGSLILLYVTRQYGFTYNYSLFILLFAGGFLVGLVLELLFRLVASKKR